MTRDNAAYDDVFMGMIVRPLVEEEIRAFDRYNQTPGEYSEKAEKKIAGILRKHEAKAVSAGIWKVLRRGLICALVGLAVVFCSCAAIPSLREKIVHAVLEWYDGYLAVYFTDPSAETRPWQELGYLPDGLAMIHEEEREGFLTQIYANGQGEMLTFMREPVLSSEDTWFSGVDSEHHMPEDVLVGEDPGIFFQGTEGYENILLWNREGYVYTLIGFFSCDVLIEMGENLQ